MPERTTVVLPARLKQLATRRARQRKISFAEFTRLAIRKAVREPLPKQNRRRDPFWTDVAVYDGPVPADVSANVDKYLYDDEP
jgi:ribosomal protein L13